MTEWISFKDAPPPEDTPIWASWRYARTGERGVHLIGRWTEQSAHFTDKEFSYTHWAIPLGILEEIPRPYFEVPKDGKAYLSLHRNYGMCFVYWDNDTKEYGIVWVGRGLADKDNPYQNILRYMDEKGNWVEL